MKKSFFIIISFLLECVSLNTLANYQEVAPFNVMTGNGLVQSTTIDPDKLKWVIAASQDGFADDNYIGYKQVPNIGNVNNWSGKFLWNKIFMLLFTLWLLLITRKKLKNKATKKHR